MLVVENLKKKYAGQFVLNGITVKVHKGEIVAILGSSGSGKSTFLRCLNYLEIPDEGKIYLEDKLVHYSEIHLARARIGMVFQNFNLFPHLSVLENLVYAPIKVKKIPRVVAVAKARGLLARVGLERKVDAYPLNLSGGEKQRVAIARTLMLDPEIILFDEPTSALDPEMIQEVLKVMKDLVATQITMLIVTHEMAFVKEVAQRVLFLDNGAILKDCPTAEFFGGNPGPRIQKFLAAEGAL
jgi:ABC-type polar amino acid transport system ATPase subunit